MGDRFDRGLICLEQRLARRPLRVDHVMRVQLKVKEHKLVVFVGGVERNRLVIDQAAGGNENIVKKQGVTL